MNLRQAAQQALEALECPGKAKTGDEQAAITALKQALAEPEQQPVAWRLYKDGELYSLKFAYEDRGPNYTWEPLFTAPTPRKPLSEDEIVRLMVGEDRARLLSAGEFAEGAVRELVESARAIERAHGIGEQHGS